MPRATTAKKPLTTSDRVLRAAADLIRRGGLEAASTRAVAATAGVPATVIYRKFGDKDGLLEAVAVFVMKEHLTEKKLLAETAPDAVQALRAMWDLHVEFGLANPHVYVLTYGQVQPGKPSPAVDEARAIVCDMVAHVAAEGRLRMSVERATELILASAVGTVLALIRQDESERDPRLSMVSRESAIAAIRSDSSRKPPSKEASVASRAVALQESLRGARNTTLSAAERSLLTEWLGKLADRA